MFEDGYARFRGHPVVALDLLETKLDNIAQILFFNLTRFRVSTWRIFEVENCDFLNVSQCLPEKDKNLKYIFFLQMLFGPPPHTFSFSWCYFFAYYAIVCI